MTASGAAAAAAATAVKASGAIVQLAPDDFQRLLWTVERPLVVAAEAWAFGTQYRYLFGHRGLVFFTKSREPLQLGGRAEVIHAKRIWVPST
jgi:hypothetical protein